MRYIAKAAGPRTIVLGSTGCMYVANTSYYTTPWVVPWMHTQLGSAGSAALGAAAGLKALMRKGKIKDEPINVIAFCGDGGGADMGLRRHLRGADARRLQLPDHPVRQRVVRQHRHPALRIDARTARTRPSARPARSKRIMHTRWKKNTAGHAGGRPSRRRVHRDGVTRPIAVRVHEQGAQGAHHRRPDVHPLARPVPEGLALRSAAVARAGQAGGRDRHLVALGDGRPRASS